MIEDDPLAAYWRLDEGRVQCELCPRGCLLKEGQTGFCRVRRVEDGKLLAAGYGFVSSAGVDPIEKKPLYHFHPGQPIFSIGGWGCNLRCEFCQNWSISQRFQAHGRRSSPEEIVGMAARDGSIGIAYTYNEPLIGFEFVKACAEKAREAGLVNVLVTNGYVRSEPAAELLPLIDALNVDVKSMEEDFYRRQCQGHLQPVLDFVKQAVAAGCLVEVTNLVIPGLNDSDELIESLAKWVSDEAGPSIPLHLSAYHPQYKADAPPTPSESLENAYEICMRSLDYVYLGNVLTAVGQDTLCPQCGAILVHRRGYRTRLGELKGDICARCGRRADIRGLSAD